MSTDDIFNVAPPRGMRDFLPAQVELRDWASNIILGTYKKFGFTRIETPVLENLDLLKSGEGGENLKLIYEVLKRGDKLDKALALGKKLTIDDLSDLGLRFDLTVPLVRYFCANQSNLSHPLKAIQIGSVFRAESPQKGRFRQFTQCDIDIIGVKSEIAEMELIQATTCALLALGFHGFTVCINDRRFLTQVAQLFAVKPELTSSAFIALDKLDKIGLEGVKKELKTDGHDEHSINMLVRFLQQISSTSQEQLRNALLTETEEKNINQAVLKFCQSDSTSAVSTNLSGNYTQSLINIISAVESISNNNFKIVFDPTLVRGMGYYTGAIFEVKVPGYSGSVAGGGRYDSMVEKFSGRETPACGFSIGFERVIDILSEKGFQPTEAKHKIAFIYDPDKDSLLDIIKASNKLRNSDNIISLQPKKKDLKKQLDALLAHGYTHQLIFKGSLENLEPKELKS